MSLSKKIEKECTNHIDEILLSMKKCHRTKNNIQLISEEPCYEQNSIIFSEWYYCNRLTTLLNNKTIPSENYEIPKLEDIWEDFSFALDKLCNLWIKFQDSPYLLKNYSEDIFRIIYEAYPQLCIEIFPVVLFVFADSYFEFCKICYIDQKHQIMPENFSDKQKEDILSLFLNKIEGVDYQYYLFSLIDIKNKYYSESSFSQGERIFKQLLSQCKENTQLFNADISDDFDYLRNRSKIVEEIKFIINDKYNCTLNKKKKQVQLNLYWDKTLKQFGILYMIFHLKMPPIIFGQIMT